ncbi:MAG TPA: PfkB family carbohydrate kinase [Terriglobales bacterium]|nr:PfkB family carbohydrate kinase [Terriglobales bacterium]
MSVLIVGSTALDSIKTPKAENPRLLGGSASHAAVAASFFSRTKLVGVVGDDFPKEYLRLYRRHRIDLDGLQVVPGKTFHWSGEYGDNLNEAKTRLTELNVFENFRPQIPAEYKESEYLFLANIDPVLQAGVRRQMDGARLVGGDTMNFWIQGKPKELAATLRLIDVLLINDGEAKLLAGDPNLPRAAHRILAKGPKALVIKHGEYGATIFFREGAWGIGRHPFRAPALPLDEVLDPTGAGDSFAGGFMGYIASQGEINREVLKRAMFYGGVMGSFAVERFGTERLRMLTRAEIDARFQLFRELTHLE